MEVELECYNENSVRQLELFHELHAIIKQYAKVEIENLPGGLRRK